MFFYIFVKKKTRVLIGLIPILHPDLNNVGTIDTIFLARQWLLYRVCLDRL